MKLLLLLHILFLTSLLPACTAHSTTRSSTPWYANIQPDPTILARVEIASDESLFPENPPLTKNQAFFMLLNAPEFCPIPYGMDGNGISKISVAFTTLLPLPDAPAAFLDLTRRATPAGKLYALCGLYLLDRPLFLTTVQPFLTDPTPVLIPRGGCTIAPKPTSQIVFSLDGTYDIFHGDYPTNLPTLSQLWLTQHAPQPPEK